MKNNLLVSGLFVLFLFSSCAKENRECPGAIEQNIQIGDFTKINAGGTFTVSVVKGNDFSIKASGCSNDLADLDLTIEPGNILDIKFENYRSDRHKVDFTITMPTLIALNLSGEASGTITGFQGQNSVIRNVISGDAKCSLNGTGINAQVELSGEAELNIAGITENLYGTISGNARLNAYDVAADEVDISTSGTSKAYVKPIQTFFVEASGESKVYYRGNPPAKYIVTSGNGKVIQQ